MGQLDVFVDILSITFIKYILKHTHTHIIQFHFRQYEKAHYINDILIAFQDFSQTRKIRDNKCFYLAFNLLSKLFTLPYCVNTNWWLCPNNKYQTSRPVYVYAISLSSQQNLNRVSYQRNSWEKVVTIKDNQTNIKMLIYSNS